ncbi:MAG: Gx transporter family protein [Caldisericia bacterium]|nr:Gx transporter family protein [Caldisericia bacterium]
MTVRKVTLFSLLLSIGLILHFLEYYVSIPFFGFVLKPGLSNIVVLFSIYSLGFKESIVLAITRGLISAFFEPSNNIVSISISFGGITLSLLAMFLFYKLNKDNILLISIFGAIFHNIGQLIVVLFFVDIEYLLYYLPLLITSGFFGGYITGWIAKLTVKKLYL